MASLSNEASYESHFLRFGIPPISQKAVNLKRLPCLGGDPQLSPELQKRYHKVICAVQPLTNSIFHLSAELRHTADDVS
jgi:hypothetical protein